MKKIRIYTDGACKGNPGPGGWGAVILYGTQQSQLCGGEENTTNNKMELTAVVKALEHIAAIATQEYKIDIYSDSAYVVNAFKQGWIKKWKYNHWKTTRSKEGIKNKELWVTLDNLVTRLKHVNFIKVKGHNGNTQNELADTLATTQAKRAKNYS